MATLQLNVPQLWVVEPGFTAQGKAEFGVSKYIYERHILLRSWLALRYRHQIQLPDETDELIAAVYDPNMAVPENIESIHAQDWQTSRDEELTPEEKEKVAKANAIKLPPPHGEVKPCDFTRKGEEDDESAIAAATRLGEPSVATIFLQGTETGLVFPGTQERVDLAAKSNLAMIRKLLSYSTRLSKKELVKALTAQDNPKTWTSALLRNCRYVEVNAQDVAVVGDWRLTLDPLLGVRVEKEK